MADKRLAAVAGFLTCGLVLLLLLILYFPNTDNPDEPPMESWHPTDPPEEAAASRLVLAARVIEDMGVTFLVLLAVVSVAAGLACLTWACCCLN